MKKAGSVILIALFISMAGIALYPWEKDEAVAVGVLLACVVLTILWLSFRLGFKIKINKVVAEGLFIVLVPILLFSGKATYNLGKELFVKRPKIQRPEPWFMGSIFDVLKLRLKPLEVVIGVKWKSTAIKIDLTDAHVMIGGSTDTGKTVLLNSIIAQLVLTNAPCDIWLFDLKAATDDAMRMWRPVIARYVDDAEPAIDALVELRTLMHRRSREGYDRETVVIIDEFVDLTSDMEEQHRRTTTSLITTLVRKGRSAGIRVVGATQYPHFADVPKKIIHNMMRRICLGVAEDTQAQVVLGYRGKVPVKLPDKPGEFVMRKGKSLRTGRSIFIDQRDIARVVERALNGDAESDPDEIRVLRTVIPGLRVGDRIPGINKTAESLPMDLQDPVAFVKVAYRNFAQAGIFELGGGSSSSGYRLAMEPNMAVATARKYLGEFWDEDIPSLWGDNGEDG
jgi:hypothetical protein